MALAAGTRLPSRPHEQTLIEEFQRHAEAVAGVAQLVLGGRLLGAYLHGSAVLGGIRPTSDVDVLAVVSQATTEDQRRALTRRLMAISDPSREQRQRPVELTVVRQGDVRPWRYPPRAEFQYGEWLRADYERGLVPEPGANPDLAPLITVVLMGNRPLLGPPPADLLDPVPAADLRRAIVAGIPELMADLEPDTRNVLLTLTRIWHTTVTGEIVSKDQAAEWAAERLPPTKAEVVRLAAAQYVNGTHGEEAWPARMEAARATATAIVLATGTRAKR